MTINTERAINSPAGLKAVIALARAMPPGLGYAIARLAAWWISNRKASAQVRAIRSNQWVVAGEKSSSRDLDQAVRAVNWNAARAIYELYHNMHNPEWVKRMYVLDPSFQRFYGRPEFERRGLMVAGLHLTGFDLGLQWICREVFKPLVLTISNPEGGRRMEFEIRQKTGMNLVPASVQGLRQALRHLQQGGVVATGIDRPIPKSDPRPRFFDRPSTLPVHHIYLALKARVPVVIMLCRLEDDGKYHFSASPLIEMDPHPNREDELRLNAEKVLAVAEGFIRQTPQQWLISLPVWPETINDVPG